MVDEICYTCFWGVNLPPELPVGETQVTHCRHTGIEGDKEPDFTCPEWEWDGFTDGTAAVIHPYRDSEGNLRGRGHVNTDAPGLQLCYPYRASGGGLMMRAKSGRGIHKCYPYREGGPGNWGGLRFRARAPCHTWPPWGPDPDIPDQPNEWELPVDDCDCPIDAYKRIRPVMRLTVRNMFGSVGTWCHPQAQWLCEYYNLSAMNGDWFVPTVCNDYNDNFLATPKSRYIRGMDCCTWLEGACGNPTVYWGLGAAFLHFKHEYIPVELGGDGYVKFAEVRLQFGGSIYLAPLHYACSYLTINYASQYFAECNVPEHIVFVPSSHEFVNNAAPPFSELNLKDRGQLIFHWPYTAPKYEDCYKLTDPRNEKALPFWRPV